MEVGVHCQFEGCNALDFLPMTCVTCGRTFCATHTNNHGCQHGTNTTAHSTSIGDVIRGKQSISSRMLCPVPGCKTEIGGVMACISCPKCSIQEKAQIAAKRTNLESSINTIAERVSAKAASAQSTTTTSTSKMSAKQKQRKQAAALLRLKMKSFGQSKVPLKERFYLTALFADESGLVRPGSATALYFKNSDSVGRILDMIAKQFGETHLNNEASGKAKLCLFTVDTEVPVSIPTSSLLRDQTVLADGGSIVLTRASLDNVRANLAYYEAAMATKR